MNFGFWKFTGKFTKYTLKEQFRVSSFEFTGEFAAGQVTAFDLMTFGFQRAGSAALYVSERMITRQMAARKELVVWNKLQVVGVQDSGSV